MSNAELIAEAREAADEGLLAGPDMIRQFADALQAADSDHYDSEKALIDTVQRQADRIEELEAKLDEAEDIALGLDYAHDHERVQALALLFGDDDE